jgi:hypothetical protein
MPIDVVSGYASVACVNLFRVDTVAAEHDTAGRIYVVEVRGMRVLRAQNGPEEDTSAAAAAAADGDVVVVVVAAVAAAVMPDVVD